MKLRQPRLALLAASVAALPGIAQAFIPYATPGSAVTQNFDTLAQTSTSNPWSNNTTVPGLYVFNSTATSGGNGRVSGAVDSVQVPAWNAVSAYVGANTGTTGSRVYSMGRAGQNPVTDRTFLTQAGSTAASPTSFPGDFFYAFVFQNTSGGDLDSFTLSYAAEQWIVNSVVTDPQRITFSYLVKPTFNAAADVPTSGDLGDYRRVTTLDGVSKQVGTAAANIDGNLPANRTALSATVGAYVPAGSYLILRWWDDDDNGNDLGVGIDDVSFSARAVADTRTLVAPGAWTDPASWSAGATPYPDTAGVVVKFPDAPAAATVTLAADVSAGVLDFASAAGHTVTGPGRITLGGEFTADINVTAGANVLAAPVSATKDLMVQLASGTSLTVADLTTAAGSVNGVRGGGTLRVEALKNAGDFTFSTPSVSLGSISGAGRMTVRPGATVTVDAPAAGVAIAQADLTVLAGGAVRVQPGAAGADAAIALDTVSVAAAGLLDLGTTDLVVRTGSVNTLRARVATYLASPVSARLGIGSSVAGTAGAPFTTVAVFGNVAAPGVAYFDAYDGVTDLTASAVIVKFTYVGDTDLDGTVTATDLTRALAGYTLGLTGWENGDVDYSGGPVTLSDYQAVLAAYQYVSDPASGAASYGRGAGTDGGGGAVPEPSALLAAVPVIALGRRRR